MKTLKIGTLLLIVTLGTTSCGMKKTTDVFSPSFEEARREVSKTQFSSELDKFINQTTFHSGSELGSLQANTTTSSRITYSYLNKNTAISSYVEKNVSQERLQYDSNNIIAQFDEKTSVEVNTSDYYGEESTVQESTKRNMLFKSVVDGLNTLVLADTIAKKYVTYGSLSDETIRKNVNQTIKDNIGSKLDELALVPSEYSSEKDKYYVDGSLLTFDTKYELSSQDPYKNITNVISAKVQFNSKDTEFTGKLSLVLEGTVNYLKDYGGYHTDDIENLKQEYYVDLDLIFKDITLDKVDISNYQKTSLN